MKIMNNSDFFLAATVFYEKKNGAETFIPAMKS